MTAAALAANKTPSMQLALDAMYGWLERHAHVGKDDVVVDTGSGLSYHTKITPHVLVQVVRSAAGFAEVGDSIAARTHGSTRCRSQAWTARWDAASVRQTCVAACMARPEPCRP